MFEFYGRWDLTVMPLAVCYALFFVDFIFENSYLILVFRFVINFRIAVFSTICGNLRLKPQKKSSCSMHFVFLVCNRLLQLCLWHTFIANDVVIFSAMHIRCCLFLLLPYPFSVGYKPLFLTSIWTERYFSSQWFGNLFVLRMKTNELRLWIGSVLVGAEKKTMYSIRNVCFSFVAKWARNISMRKECGQSISMWRIKRVFSRVCPTYTHTKLSLDRSIF